MSEPRRRRADVILEPSYVEGLGDKTIEDVRAMHEECMEVETEVSYVRRLAQARIDIVQAELDRREAGGTIGDLVAALPQILADEGPRGDPVTSRLPRHLAPAPAIEWKRGLERLITDATLVEPADVVRSRAAEHGSSSCASSSPRRRHAAGRSTT